MSKTRYYRKSTSITISTFYEQYQLKKYRMDPPYQRDFGVWTPEQKSFLMDTIYKNFPVPPIFLEQIIDPETGITKYDVIDGKQRLSTIVEFIENKVCLPNSFGNDIYGDSRINGKTFEEIKAIAKENEEIKELIADFWAYSISIEYIENPDIKIVDNIFDRLNREGSRLNSQELRNAQFYDTRLYNDIVDYRNDVRIKKLTAKLNKNRMEDLGFITELFLLTLTRQVFEGKDAEIDRIFSTNEELYDEQKSSEVKEKFERVLNTFMDIDIDLAKFSIEGVSHLYALWYLAMVMEEKNINADSVKVQLNDFFSDLRDEKLIEEVQTYKQSMQSASKSKSARNRRVKALLDYLNIKE